MLTVELLPADQGDALLLEYGNGARTSQILVDGGPSQTFEVLRRRISRFRRRDRHFELLIVTHLDSDHIQGVIRLQLDKSLGCSFGDIWLNDWPQVVSIAEVTRSTLAAGFGGEKPGFKFLCTLLKKLKLPLNRAWRGGPVVVPRSGPLPVVELPGGARITLLSPEPAGLLKLHTFWLDVVNGLGFRPGDEKTVMRQLRALQRHSPLGAIPRGDQRSTRLDRSVANGSSIAVLVEHGRRRVLLAGDAYPSSLVRSLRRWMIEMRRPHVALDAFKLSHHGSKANIHPALLDLIRCRHYLLSTSGRLYGHPSREAIELLIEHRHGRVRPVLHFNYRTPATIQWEDRSDQRGRGYRAIYPSTDAGSVLALP